MKILRFLIVLFFGVTGIGFTIYSVKNLVVKDTMAPVITCDSDILEVDIEAGEEKLLAGMKAEDNKDGDVTDSLVVVSKSKFFEKGKLRVNYAAFDKKSNVGTYTREVVYRNYTSPRFTVLEPLRVRTDNEKWNILDVVKAEDCLDGNISGLIKTQAGEYLSGEGDSGRQEIYLQVTNSAGDTVQTVVQVEILEKNQYNLPYPKLSEYLVYTKVNQQLDLSQYVTGVFDGGYEYLFAEQEEADRNAVYEPMYVRENIAVSQEVDYSAPGTYPVRYTLQETNELGQVQTLGSTVMYVVVEE